MNTARPAVLKHDLEKREAVFEKKIVLKQRAAAGCRFKERSSRFRAYEFNV